MHLEKIEHAPPTSSVCVLYHLARFDLTNCFPDFLLPFPAWRPTGGQFTEDGSFIGQYVPGKPPVSAQSTPQNPSLQGANAGMATYV